MVNDVELLIGQGPPRRVVADVALEEAFVTRFPVELGQVGREAVRKVVEREDVVPPGEKPTDDVPAYETGAPRNQRSHKTSASSQINFKKSSKIRRPGPGAASSLPAARRRRSPQGPGRYPGN